MGEDATNRGSHRPFEERIGSHRCHDRPGRSDGCEVGSYGARRWHRPMLRLIGELGEAESDIGDNIDRKHGLFHRETSGGQGLGTFVSRDADRDRVARQSSEVGPETGVRGREAPEFDR